MKKIFQTSLTILALALTFASCSTTKSTSTSASTETSAANISRGKFTGTWTLTNVSYDGLVANAVQNVFDQASPSAFVGSTWKFTQ